MVVKTRTVRWEPATAPDVQGYKVYYAQGAEPDYSSPFVDVGSRTEIQLPADVPGSEQWDGVFHFGITAYDEVGNESAMSFGSAPFDFIAPDAPGLVEIV